MDELKPCPFCGGEAELYESEAYNLKNGGKVDQTLWFVTCQDCTALLCGDLKKKAVEMWNRRAGEADEQT